MEKGKQQKQDSIEGTQRSKDAVLVTLADRNFINQAKQLFSSVYWNAGWKGDYMLLAHEIPEKDLKWFRDKGILVKKCEPLYGQKLPSGHSPIILDKFYLFTPEFKKWKNIVYLDADIIVRASLDRLAKVKGFWAVAEGEKRKSGKSVMQIINWIILDKNVGFNLEEIPFGTEVFAFSADLIDSNVFPRMEYLFSNYKEAPEFGDQLVFNLVFYGKWENPGFGYNLNVPSLVSHSYIKPDKMKGAVLHFSNHQSKFLPWNKNNPFYLEWKNNLEKSGLINLGNIPEREKWRKSDSFRCYLSFFIYPRFRRRASRIAGGISGFMLMLIGLAGRLIKKINPSLYHKLKNIK